MHLNQLFLLLVRERKISYGSGIAANVAPADPHPEIATAQLGVRQWELGDCIVLHELGRAQVTSSAPLVVENLFLYAQSPYPSPATGYVAILNKLNHVLASQIIRRSGRSSINSSDIAISAPSHARSSSHIETHHARPSTSTSGKQNTKKRKGEKNSEFDARYPEFRSQTPLIFFIDYQQALCELKKEFLGAFNVHLLSVKCMRKRSRRADV